MLSPRNRELLGLLPAALLVTAGFTAIFIQAQQSGRGPRPTRPSTSTTPPALSLTYGAIFLGLCLAGHLVIRFALPNADPYLFPLAAVLASVGIVMVYRINPTLARQQAQWMVLGLVLFAATILALRRGGRGGAGELPLHDRGGGDRHAGAAAAARDRRAGQRRLPRRPRRRRSASSPRSSARSRSSIFLASYLRDNRQILVTAGRRVLGVTIPPMKQFGPLLLVWGAAMAMLLVTREIGTSLMFFGAFLALLYVATGRVSFPLVGLLLFAAGAWYLGDARRARARPRARLGAPVRPRALPRGSAAATSSRNGLFAQADGGLLGVGFGQSMSCIRA